MSRTATEDHVLAALDVLPATPFYWQRSCSPPLTCFCSDTTRPPSAWTGAWPAFAARCVHAIGFFSPFAPEIKIDLWFEQQTVMTHERASTAAREG